MNTTIGRQPEARRAPARAASLLVTFALAVLGLTTVPASTAAAADAVPAPSLTWKISDWYNEHLSVRTFSDGAKSDTDGVVTFPDGVGTFDSGSGVTSVKYSGGVRGSFVNGGTEFYSVSIANPAVTIDGTGEGTITADVSWSVGANIGPPARVTLTTFDAEASSWTTSGGLRSLTTTPDWDGVLPAGSAAATDAGISNTSRPVDGKSFAAPFITTLNAGVKAHFYASTSANDAKKAPSAFIAQAPVPATTVTTTSATPGGGLALAVSGTGFTRTTNPGDAGVYVGLAPSGQLPDTSTFDVSGFAGANWVMPATIDETTGAFTSTINAPTAKLDPTKSYSVFTWRAHSHSTPSQNTETPVVIDFQALGLSLPTPPVVSPPAEQQAAPSKVSVKRGATKKPTTKKAGKTSVSIKAADGSTVSGGKVKVTFKSKGKPTKTKTVTVKNGKASVTVPKLAKGTWKVSVKYLGSTLFIRTATLQRGSFTVVK